VDEGQTSHWLEISLNVDDELAEAVAEVLSRYVANGVVIERDIEYMPGEETGTPSQMARVYGYLPVDSRLEEKRQLILQSLWHLGQIQELPEPVFRELADQDWMSAWKEHYQPIPVGERIMILPAWVEKDPPDRIPVRIDPSMAFGTGIHPSTQLCLQMIETYLRPGNPMIDVGCGSGVLSIAALKLGAKYVAAVDTDPMAVRATQENALINKIVKDLEVRRGSIEQVLEGHLAVERAPLVMANILASVVISLLGEGLAWLVSPGGVLVVSGILAEQEDRVKEAAEEKGLNFMETRRMADWVALGFRRPK
jgi:ribosomal protein L11 methyltransferase